MTEELWCHVRTSLIVKCPVCGSLTNEAEKDLLKPNDGEFRFWCPQKDTGWHERLHNAILRYREALTQGHSREIKTQRRNIRKIWVKEREPRDNVRYLGLAQNPHRISA
jgi:hypothetical protein